MPYLYETLIGIAARGAAASPPPSGPGLKDSEIETLEIWHSSFKDPGEDYTEFKAYDQAGTLLKTVRVAGY